MVPPELKERPMGREIAMTEVEQCRDTLMQLFPGMTVRAKHESVHHCDGLDGCDVTWWTLAVIDSDAREIGWARDTSAEQAIAKLVQKIAMQPAPAGKAVDNGNHLSERKDQ